MGRTQTFDEDQVIDQVQALFWRKGFSATSLADLQEATGLHKGSLYRTFKSKEHLFLLALDRYAEGMRAAFIDDEDPVVYLRNFFKDMIKECSRDDRGCFVMNCCVELGDSQELTGQVARKLFDEVNRNLNVALKQARKVGALPPHADVNALTARFAGAAFAIREMSKFERNPARFRAIANGVLSEVGAQV